MKKYTILLFLLIPIYGFNQDLNFAAKYSSASNFNPALTGLSSTPRITGIFQNRWPSLSGGIQSGLVLYDQNISAIQSGVGLSYFGQYFANGAQRDQEWNLHYAYHLQLDDQSHLGLGLNGGIKFTYINLYEITWPGEPQLIDEKSTEAQLDFGAVYSRENLLIGFSANNLPSLFGEGAPILLNAHAAYIQPINDEINLGLETALLTQDGFYQLRSSVQANYKFMVLGLTHTGRDSFGVIGGVAFDQFKCSYNFARQIGSLSNSSLNLHEISFRWNFLSKNTQNSTVFNWRFF